MEKTEFVTTYESPLDIREEFPFAFTKIPDTECYIEKSMQTSKSSKEDMTNIWGTRFLLTEKGVYRLGCKNLNILWNDLNPRFIDHLLIVEKAAELNTHISTGQDVGSAEITFESLELNDPQSNRHIRNLLEKKEQLGIYT